MLKAEIYLDMGEMRQDKPLYEYILELLVNENISGATAIKGFTGFGANQYLKKPGALFSFDEQPVLIIFIDDNDKVTQALNTIRKQVSYGLIVTSNVDKWDLND